MSLIHGFHLSDVVITGKNGTIDGNGEFWWRRHGSGCTKGVDVDCGVETHTRGHLIELMWCSDIVLSHLSLRMSPFWTVHPVYSKGFTAHDLTIYNPSHSPNTDGIDPDSTSDVDIHDCRVITGDDCEPRDSPSVCLSVCLAVWLSVWLAGCLCLS